MVSQSLTLQASFADLVFLRELTRSTVNKKNRCAWLKSRSDQNISTLKCADAGSSGLACFRSFVSCVVSCVMSFVIFVLRSCTVLHHTPGNMTYWAASSAVAPVVRRHLALLDLLVPRECPGQSDRSSDLGLLHPISFSVPALARFGFQELKQWKASRPLATIQHKTDWTC